MSYLNINPANQPIETTSTSSGSTTINISGQVVNISGQSVVTNVSLSGVTLTTNISGQIVRVETSGQAFRIMNASGNSLVLVRDLDSDEVPISGGSLSTQAFSYGFDWERDAWERVNVSCVSGYSVQPFAIHVITHAPGITNANGFQASSLTMVTAASGGTLLDSNTSCFKAMIKNLSGNTPMFIAGRSGGTRSARSGRGWVLYGSDEVTIDGIDNLNELTACATTSGQQLCAVGVA